MSKLKWFLEKLVDVVFDVVAGIILYLIVGGYISQPLSEIFPQLPTILTVSVVLAIIVGFLYRLFKSIRFHRFIERTCHNLVNFLRKWDELNDAFDEAINSRAQEAIARFENHRAWLLYTYPKVSSATKITKYSYIDRIQGIAIHNYDIIGNLIAKSPFIGLEWFNIEFACRDFKKKWDRGRTILVYTIGYFDHYRQNTVHKIYWILRLVPFLKTKQNLEKGENTG